MEGRNPVDVDAEPSVPELVEMQPYWNSSYTSRFPLPQWSLVPPTADNDTGVQLKV